MRNDGLRREKSDFSKLFFSNLLILEILVNLPERKERKEGKGGKRISVFHKTASYSSENRTKCVGNSERTE